MRKKIALGALIGAFVLAAVPIVVMAQYNVLNYIAQGGALWEVGATLDIATGGKLTMNGVDRTAALSTAPAAVAAGYKIARGQLTTATAADTVVTGLTTVVAIVATLDSDLTDDPEWVSATIGDQAGAPAAGSVIIKTWKNTGGTDPTPLAATTFAKKVNWIAIGS